MGRRAQAETKLQIEELFHLPLAEAARLCNTGTTCFKKICRARGIYRWPYRKYKTLQTTTSMLAKMPVLQEDAEEAKQVHPSTVPQILGRLP